MYINDNRRSVDHVHKKWVKILTVITYIISVSLVGVVLGLYYKLMWNPKYESADSSMAGTAALNASSSEFMDEASFIHINPNDDSAEFKELESKILSAITDTLRKEKANSISGPYSQPNVKVVSFDQDDSVFLSVLVKMHKSHKKKPGN